ncbi:hypothetical protein ACFV0Y_02915 [Streptomyces sp. NPDC059569]
MSSLPQLRFQLRGCFREAVAGGVPDPLAVLGRDSESLAPDVR